MRTDDLDYDLPDRLIARTPADRRDAARLMVARTGRSESPVEHRTVADLPTLLKAGDLLVINDTRVLAAKFVATRIATGGRVEGLFIETRDDRTWHVMLRSGGHLTAGESLELGDPGVGSLRLIERMPDGSWIARKVSEMDTEALLDRVGTMPLPPYIERAREHDRAAPSGGFDEMDRRRYQTLYAAESGAVAAPTAGLHFTDELIERLGEAGVRMARLTLHVGPGTFAPVRTDTLEEHDMHAERFTIPVATLDAIGAARREGRRIIPVGTTSVRALESLPAALDESTDYSGRTRLLIQPGFAFRFTDGLMTNFHLPRSTLLALVAAKTGLDRLKSLYAAAIAGEYRFYSYGDAMLILDE